LYILDTYKFTYDIYIYDKNIYVFNKYNNQAIKQVIISNYISGPYYTYRKCGLYFSSSIFAVVSVRNPQIRSGVS